VQLVRASYPVSAFVERPEAEQMEICRKLWSLWAESAPYRRSQLLFLTRSVLIEIDHQIGSRALVLATGYRLTRGDLENERLAFTRLLAHGILHYDRSVNYDISVRQSHLAPITVRSTSLVWHLENGHGGGGMLLQPARDYLRQGLNVRRRPGWHARDVRVILKTEKGIQSETLYVSPWVLRMLDDWYHGAPVRRAVNDLASMKRYRTHADFSNTHLEDQLLSYLSPSTAPVRDSPVPLQGAPFALPGL